MGYTLIVITNQSGVARGYFTENDVNKFHKQMNEDLYQSNGIKIDKFYFSPFHPDGSLDKYSKQSNCRKPGNALFKLAIQDFNISSSHSIAIGDKYTDLEPALNCGVECVYLLEDKKEFISNSISKVRNFKNWYELIANIKSTDRVFHS